jgi:release factor H-coupled RctB family protein
MSHAIDMTRLPPHARVVARDDVWMEGEGIEQLARVANLPGCVRAVGMPDLHPGPVGAVFAFTDRVRPELLGGDGGCGVRITAAHAGRMSLDAIERRVQAALDDDPLTACDGRALFDAVWRGGARALADLEGVPDALARLAALETDGPFVPSGDPEPYRAGFEAQLGTVGGGNHFVEIARVASVPDPATAAGIGLAKGGLVVVAHSGSRGLGHAIARRAPGARELVGEEIAPYLADLAGACRYARANRLVLAYRMLCALGAARPDKIAGGFDVTHNDVARETVGGAPAWIHRKGAAPARGADPTIVLGSRGAPSWVLRATDSEEGLRSVAHGAGRRMTRSEARGKLKARYARAELRRTRLGGRVICADPELLYEEHPDAYKPVEPVVASLVEAGLATPVAELVPMLTVKR